ncbi:MAG: hypothetical protein IJE07_14640 [Clostridia bacterium]|nr:hypothetical protein [Clostridia bacterium]
MNQMALLWAYQAEDMKADRLEREIRRSPLRQQMENDRTQHLEKQKQHKQIENQVNGLADRKDAIRDALQRAQEQLRGLHARYDAAPPSELESVQALIGEVRRCLDTINGYEKELRDIGARVRDLDQRASAIRNEAARLRSDFDKLRAMYDEQMPPKKAALEKQRAVVEQKRAEIPAELMERYLEVKRRIVPPLARLNGDQCSGCNTSLPSAVLHSVRNAGDALVECVSCGRIILRL